MKYSEHFVLELVLGTHPPLFDGCCERELLDWGATLQFDMATFEAFSVQRGDNSFDDMTSFEACSVDEGRAFLQAEGFLIGDIVAFLLNSIPSLNKIGAFLLCQNSG